MIYSLEILFQCQSFLISKHYPERFIFKIKSVHYAKNCYCNNKKVTETRVSLCHSQERETTLMEHEKFNIITYYDGIGVMRCCLVKNKEDAERERERTRTYTGATPRAERDPKEPPPPKAEIQALAGQGALMAPWMAERSLGYCTGGPCQKSSCKGLGDASHGKVSVIGILL